MSQIKLTPAELIASAGKYCQESQSITEMIRHNWEAQRLAVLTTNFKNE